MFEWEEYSSELYVDRKKELDDLLKWVNAPSVSKQVKSLVAPPGAGKTWFLQAVQEKLEKRVKHSDALPERLVIFCQARRFANSDKSSSAALSNNEIRKWLKEEIQRAAQFCPAVGSIPVDDRDVETEALFGQLAAILCDQCTWQHPVIVLADGLDDVSSAQASKIEEQILRPFIGKKCVQMIIAHRDEYGLQNDTLRRNNGEESRIRLSELPSVQEQFQKFKDRFYSDVSHLTSTNLDPFLRSLTRYQWNHPYVNAFLFDKALVRVGSDATRLLATDDLRECLYAVIERRDETGKPRFGELKKETFDCLKRIASELPDDWSLTDLLKKLGLREQDECMKQLFEYGVAFYNPTTKRYQLAVGLRELARDLVERGG